MRLRQAIGPWVTQSRDEERRIVAFVAGPPGCGKSLFVEHCEVLLGRYGMLQALPMDGFHLRNHVLEERTIEIDGERLPLRRVKGSPESFDLEGLTQAVRRLVRGESLRWPIYDRETHDPVAEAIEVIDQGVVLVEGNYLLLDEPGWRDLGEGVEHKLFLESDEEEAHAWLLKRHIHGGRSPEDAERHYEFNDLRNRRRILENRLSADYLIRHPSDGSIIYEGYPWRVTTP